MSRHPFDGPWCAFDTAWFESHQTTLLALLRMPLVGRWFRWILCITKEDVGHRREILALFRDGYVVAGREPDEYILEVRTHPKYAKRLYHAFRPLWWMLHAWDWAVADRWVPALSFGFDTLTTYPDAHPETSSVDGRVSRYGGSQTFVTITSGAGSFAADNEAGETIAEVEASSTTDQFYEVQRGFFLFSLAALSAGAAVSAAVFSVLGTGKSNGLGSSDLTLTSCNPASNTALVASDYALVGSTSFGSVAYASFDASSSAYTGITLNASGLATLTPGDAAKLATRLAWDVAGSFTGTWASAALSRYQARFSDFTGTSSDPKLEITYSTHLGRGPLFFRRHRNR